jgi:hypothetical protein
LKRGSPRSGSNAGDERIEHIQWACSGAPFLPGLGQVRLVKPATGEHVPFFAGLRTVVDVLPFGGETVGFFVLEFSRDLLAGLPGRVPWYDSPTATPVTFAEGLVTPVNMAIDRRTAIS